MNLIHYLLEANLYLAAFYILYVLLLRSETLYQLNRAYLLITSAVAFIIPVVQLGFLKPVVKPLVSIATVSIDEGLTTVKILPAPVQAAPAWAIGDYALAVYAVVTLVLLAYLIFKIVKLIALSKKGIAKRQRGFTVIEIPGQNVAFSFFSYLFVNTELLSSPTILHHEEVHIRQKHSLDVIYFELIKIANWFNPVVYLLQKSLKEVHEFIADQQVANSENGAADYADFLISNAYGLTPIQLTNSFFNKNLLKRRIIMLYQKKSGRAARLKYLLTLPLLAGLLCLSTMAFTNKNYAWVNIAPKHTVMVNNSLPSPVDTLSDYEKGRRDYLLEHPQGKTNDGLSQQQTQPVVAFPKPTLHLKYDKNSSDPIYNTSDVLPSFPGGLDAFSKFLAKNIKYPEAAKNANVQGRVFLQFIIEKDGNLTDVKIRREPGMGLGAEAMRVLKLSPKWTPGTVKGKAVRVEFTVPVNFALAASDKKIIDTMKTTGPIPEAINKTPTGDAVYNAVETQPTFSGGTKAFADFLRNNIKYPAIAKTNNVQGKAYVQFIVEKDGALSNVKIIREPGSGIGDEAARVMNLSPKWNPGLYKGEKVRVQFTIPINFSLAETTESNDINGLYKFMQSHVRYPAAAKIKDIQGRTFVQFTVNANQQIQDIKVLRTPDDALGAEVVRVLQKFDKLTDAKTGVTYSIPVNFYIDHGDKKDKEVETPKAKDANATPYSPKEGDRVMLNEVVVITYGSRP